MSRLTEANYLSRRVKLSEHLVAATAAYSDAAFRHEIGEAAEDSVSTAKQNVTAIEDRIAALDVAWARARAEALSERDAAQAEKRAAAVNGIDSHLKGRTAAARELVKAARSLGAAWRDWEAEGAAVIETLLPFARELGGEQIKELRHIISGEYHSMLPQLGGELAGAGLRLRDSDFAPHAFNHGGIVEFAESRNELARRIVAALVEEPN